VAGIAAISSRTRYSNSWPAPAHAAAVRYLALPCKPRAANKAKIIVAAMRLSVVAPPQVFRIEIIAHLLTASVAHDEALWRLWHWDDNWSAKSSRREQLVKLARGINVASWSHAEHH